MVRGKAKLAENQDEETDLELSKVLKSLVMKSTADETMEREKRNSRPDEQ